MIQEEFHDGIREALMANFPSAIDALLELIDNGVDDWEGDFQKHRIEIDIELDTSKKKITIRTKGELGMGYKELEDFLKWGHSRKVGRIGQWGQGGKAACGYLAEGLRLRCSKRGEGWGWEIDDPTWGTRKSRGIWEPRRFHCSAGDAFVDITLCELKRSLTLEGLVARISSVYRPLLESEKVVVHIRNGKGGRKVVPVVLLLKEGPKDFVLKLSNGSEAQGWVGVMTPKIRKGAEHVRGGIRCYHYGRLISDGEFFGHPEPSFKASLNSLTGELYLNFPIAPNLNKTNFDKDSPEWRELQEKSKELLKPWVHDLLREREKDVPKKEIDRVKKALRLVQEAFKALDKQFRGKGVMGGSQGQKPPQTKQEGKGEGQEEERKRKQRSDIGGTHEPRTPPDPGDTGTRRRLGGVDIDVQEGDETTRSLMASVGNGDEVNRRIKVIVYSHFPAYEASRDNRKGHMLYLMETLALELAKPGKDEEDTVGLYVERANQALGLAAKALLKVT